MEIDLTDLTLLDIWSLTDSINAIICVFNLVLEHVDFDMYVTVGDVYGIAQQLVAEKNGLC